MKPTDQTIDDFLNILPAVLYEYHQNQDVLHWHNQVFLS